jgi:hypothetical protein
MWSIRIPDVLSDLLIGLTALSNKENRPECGQLIVHDFAEPTTKLIESQSNQSYMAEVMQRLDEILQRVDPFAVQQTIPQ